MDKLLSQFVAIAESGSFTRAAKILNVTQPTLTFNMKKLEESLKVSLFKRSARGVTLTSYGLTLFQNARVMQRLYDNTLEAIEARRIKVERGFSIGTGYSWWELFLRDWTYAHRAKYPDAPVHISVGNQLRSMDQLLAGEISLFLGHEIPGITSEFGAEFIPFGWVKQGYFVREGHPLLDQPRSKSEIHAYPGVYGGAPDGRYQRLFLSEPDVKSGAWYAEENFSFSSNSLSICVDYVLNSDAVYRFTTVMTDYFKRRGLHRIELIPTEGKLWERAGMYVSQDTQSDPRSAKLVTEILSIASEALAEADGLRRDEV